MKKIFLFILIIILLLATGVTLAAGYVGLVPGLSNVMVKQRDLGIEPDTQQVVEINSQLGHEVQLSSESMPYLGQPHYEGTTEIAASFSEQQVTSVLDSWARNWAITPFSHPQVKINPDGTAEASFILKIQPAIALAKQLGYSDEQIATASKYATFIQGDLPVYAAGVVSVIDNQVSLTMPQLQIGNVSVPTDITSQVVGAVEDAVERRMGQVTNLDVKKLDLNGGKLNIEGTVPQVEKGE